MNIYQAKYDLTILNASSKNQALISKLGIKSKYYHNLVYILTKNEIIFNDNNLLEIKWRILHLDFDIKSCTHCNTPLTFVSQSKGFRKFCSRTCGAKHRDNISRGGFAHKNGRLKAKNTIYKKYGVEHHMHVPEFFEKQQSNRYKNYLIFSPSGKEYFVQGYERFVIPALWNEYQEDDIIVDKKIIPYIKYYHDSKIKKYYPDGYIKSSNTIVEVKSIYTIKSPTLLPKMEGCINSGYNPLVYLYDKGKISELCINDVCSYLEFHSK